MSDFDRNYATPRTGYRTDQVTIDAGLRAYMIRVYNYM
ncbi:MAG: BAX inhibitor (BI)-1/YccA family protein, partial [Xanthobacteraceae bacterium]